MGRVFHGGIKWRAVKNEDGTVNKYAIRSADGFYTITKYYLEGATLFALFNGDTCVGHYADDESAKEAADKLFAEDVSIQA